MTVGEVICKRDASSISFFEEQLGGTIRHGSVEALRPGAGRVYALIVTRCSVETNLRMREAYTDAVRQVKDRMEAEAARRRQTGFVGPAPELRLVPVKSGIFGGVCEEIFGAPGTSGDGLAITSATLAKALDEVYEGLQANRDIGKRNWMRSTLVKALRSPAEERLPIEG